MNNSSKISGKVLVVQLGREETQLVLLGSGNDILYGSTIATPMGAVEDGVIRNPEAVQQMLKSALREPELKRVRQAVFCLSTSQVITDTVTTPDLPAARLDKLIQANADMYFPVDVADYKIVWQAIGPKASAEGGLKELDVRLWAVPNSMLAPYYNVANGCGLSLVAVDYCGHSIAAAVGATFASPAKAAKKKPKLDLNMEITLGKKKPAPQAEPAIEDTEPRSIPDTTAYLLLDKDMLGMTCVRNGQVVFQRFLRCGSHPSYQLGELAMMLEFFRAGETGRGSSISGIYFGELAGNQQLSEDLAEALGIPLMRMDVPYSLHWVACIGAARTNLDFGIPGLNKPGTARKAIQSSLWQYALILIGGLMLISSLFSLLTARLNWTSDLGIRAANVQALQVESQKYAGYADNYESYVAAYNAYSSDWETVFANLQTNNDNLVLVMDELEELLPEKASVVDMQIGATGLNVTFACETKEQAAYMIMAMRDMQYADLLGVSSLAGGGNGPAETYGTGRDSEQAPVEGGSSVSSADRQRLMDSLDTDMDPYKVGYYMGLGKNTPDLLREMAAVYGAVPVSSFESLEEVEADLNTRSNAFYAMCTANPFAMRAATDMLYRDYMDGGELSGYLAEDLKASWYEHRSPADLERDLENVLDLIYYNDNYSLEELFPAIEDLIVRYEEAESWYLYYLEGEMNGENPMPYLDLELMTDDLLDGKFDSGYKDINTILTNLLSGDTKAILEEIQGSDPTEPGVDPTDPQPTETEPTETEPTESLPTLPTLPSDPFQPTESEPTGPTETEPTETEPTETEPTETEPTETDPTLPGEMDMDTVMARFTQVMDTYLATGETGLSTVEQITVEAAIDKYLPAYSGMSVEELLDDQLMKYYTYGESDFPQFDQAIEDYVAENPDKEAELQDKYAQEVSIELALKEYLSKGKTDHPEEGAIKRYLTEGTTQDDAMDEALNAYVAAGNVDTELTALLMKDAESLNNIQKTMLANYQAGTGNAVLNQRLQVCQDAMNSQNPDLPGLPDISAEELDKALKILEPVMKNYLETGDLGLSTFDKLILEGVLGEPADEFLDRQLTEYFTDGSTGREAVDAMLDKCLETLTEEQKQALKDKYDANRQPSDPTDPTDPSDSAPTDPTESDPTDPSLPADKDEIMERFAQVMDTYLTTGETGLTNAEEVLIQAAIEKYLPAYSGMSIEELLDDQLMKYFTFGESDFPEFDDVIAEYLENNPDKEAELKEKYQKEVTIEMALKEYLQKGKTNFEESLIKKYLREGQCGVTEYKEKLDKYISDGSVDSELTALLVTDPDKIENQTFKTMLDNYKAGTGNQVVNDRLKACEEAYQENLENTIDRLQKLLKRYLEKGSKTGDAYDVVIEAYLRGELKKYDDYAEINDGLNAYVKDGQVDAELKKLIEIYSKNANAIPSAAIVKMFENYYDFGDTGSKELTERIRVLQKQVLDAMVEAANKNAANKNASQPYVKPDTRIYFTAVLAYNNELRFAELERKGLDPDEKIELIEEVGEE